MFKIAPLAPTLFLFAAMACATSRPVTHEQLAGVSLTFDHFGGVADPLKQRMGEPGQLPEARESGKNYWLRLTNSSNDVISFRTYSTYVKPPLKWFDLGNGSKVIALEDGMEITLPFGSESQRGEEVPVGEEGDMFWMSFLPSGRSVLFSVPPAALKNRRKVYVEFQKALERNGRAYRTYFEAPSLN